MKARDYKIKSEKNFLEMLDKWVNEKEDVEKGMSDLKKRKKEYSQEEFNVFYEDVMKKYRPYRNAFYSDDLSLAIQEGDVKQINALRKYGAVFNIKDQNGNTPLILAVQNGELATINALLDETDPDMIIAMINAQNNKHESALQFAARLGHAEVVGLLLANGANPNVRDMNGTTPLLSACAAENRNPVLIQALLNHGADANLRGKHKLTPLHWAATHGDLALTGQLLRYGADLSIKDAEGNTPADKASSFSDKTYQAIAALLESIQSLIPGRRAENQLNFILGAERSKSLENIATRKQLTPEVLRALVIRATELGSGSVNIAVVVNNILENNGPDKTKFLKESGVIAKICRCLKREVENGTITHEEAKTLTRKLMGLNDRATRKQIANCTDLATVQMFINARGKKSLKGIDVPAAAMRRHALLADTHSGVRERLRDAAKETEETELRNVVGSKDKTKGRKK